jgi:hypothetical protein
MKIVFKYILLLLFISSSGLFSQEVHVEINKSEFLIGDHLELSIEITQPENVELIIPNPPDSILTVSDDLKGLEEKNDENLVMLEFIKSDSVDTLSMDGILKIRTKFIYTSFDSGRFEFPALTFAYISKETAETKDIDFKFIKSKSIPLRFAIVEVDTSGEIKDIKTVMDAPFSFSEIEEIVYWTLAILAIILIAIWIKKKYFTKDVEEDTKKYDPKIPAHVLALGSLKNLEDEKLWQKGELKLYYTKLTDILRLYISRVFEVDSLEMPTDETIDALINSKKSPDGSAVQLLENILQSADMVKFAKSSPDPTLNENAIKLAFEFINVTKHFSQIEMDEGEEVEIIQENKADREVENIKGGEIV